jgi:xylan 1,4-beta-xylosidase
MAGLCFFYDDENHHYLYVTHDEATGRCLRVLTSDHGRCSEPLARPIPLGEGDRVWLTGELEAGALRFSYSTDGTHWHPIGLDFDATILSDEAASKGLGFTGAFVCLCAQDLEMRRAAADFDYLEYLEFDDRAGRAATEHVMVGDDQVEAE